MKQEAGMRKLKIKKGDKVKVIAGRDVGKEGRVEKVIRDKNRLIVSEVNLLKKFVKKGREGEPSGIVSVPGPVDASNVMLVCPKCNNPVRVGFKLKKSGKRVRICRRCGEEID
jgi:large subunit ribosomal protein L24